MAVCQQNDNSNRLKVAFWSHIFIMRQTGNGSGCLMADCSGIIHVICHVADGIVSGHNAAQVE